MKVLGLAMIFPLASYAAIFGQNNLRPVVEKTKSSEIGRSIAVAVISSSFAVDPNGNISLNTDRLDGVLCKDEPLANDPSLYGACTGFLVAPDLLITAGHCQINFGEIRHESGGYCGIYGWLFDYSQAQDGSVQTKGISPDRYYRCKEIKYAVMEAQAPFRDFAIVQLDRPVLDREPLPLATNSVELGEAVSMIGFPFGTPMKSSDRAQVIFDDPVASGFVSNLDAFEGNSGSPVFNSREEVVGLLVGGTPEFSTYFDSENKCERLNRCDENGDNCILPDEALPPDGFPVTGSDVQRIQDIAAELR